MKITLCCSTLRRYVDGERHLLFEEKSRTFANNVSIETAAAYLAEIAARLEVWAADIQLPPAG
jgi:hypothetical protein